MLTIEFKTKAYNSRIYSDEHSRPFVSVKKNITRADVVDMQAFRNHPKYGGLANSDLANGLIRKLVKSVIGEKQQLDTDNLPNGVTVDMSGFLAKVTIQLEN